MNIIGLPTSEQIKTCFVLSVGLTKMYQSINLIRVDERTKEIYFLVGEEIELVIFENTSYKFIRNHVVYDFFLSRFQHSKKYLLQNLVGHSMLYKYFGRYI